MNKQTKPKWPSIEEQQAYWRAKERAAGVNLAFMRLLMAIFK
jgi:hypothetical protein